MTTLLDRYLYRQFTKNLLLVGGSLVALYVLVDFFEKVDNFAEAGQGAGRALHYLLLKIPLIVVQLMPVCLLLAAVITLGVLNHHRELLALKAGGLSLRRIVNPILGITLLFTILNLAANEWLLPSTLGNANRIWYEEVKKTKAQGIVRHGQVFYKGRKGIYTFQRPSENNRQFTDFNYVAWSGDYTLEKQLTAARATWQEGIWTLEKGRSKIRKGDGGYLVAPFENLQLTLPDSPEEFFIPAYRAEEAPLSEQWRAAWQTATEAGVQARAKLHMRLSYIFLGLPLVLLGLPILIIINQRWRRDLSVAIPISCIMAFFAWGWWSAAQSLIKIYHLDPLLTSWSLHLLVGGLGLLMLKRQDI
ncbi:MAG: YjgP/YjgQ family permease [Desulfobulbaceae bacterium]|nr:YjgP/YjgQ family permease [Desulfobulbaceae bacterium]